MKFETPKNNNYAAIVVKLKNVRKLENCDNLVGAPLFGFQAILDKSHSDDELGVFFPVECQLSDDFCRENNLYRRGDKNKDQAAKGYIEDNRRVKAIKLRGNRSDCLFMPIESLAWTKAKIYELNEGDTFDTLNGKEICKKYTLPIKVHVNGAKPQPKTFQRVEKRFIPENIDSDNYWYHVFDIKPDQMVVVTQKLHGTSIRIGNIPVRRRMNPVEWGLSKLHIASVNEYTHDYIYGSRRVIKDVNNPYQKHFYSYDIWGTEGEKLKGLIPEGFVVYGELIGWTADGAPIQRDYTYCQPEKTCALYVYRVATVNSQGVSTDLSWDQVREFCDKTGLKHVPELMRCTNKKLNAQSMLDIRFVDHSIYKDCPVPTNPGFVDEGICIRLEGLTPVIYKAKSPLFLQHESKLLDEGTEDIEAEQSEVL